MIEILIVDDEPLDREAAQRCMRGIDGLELQFASNGEEAVERMDAHCPQLVLTDLRMPKMDGLALVEYINEEWSEIPVVLMTSQGNERIAVKALNAGAASYVPKQHLRDDLRPTILRVLELVESAQMRADVVGYLTGQTTHFELPSEPRLVPAITTFTQENLSSLQFGNATTRMQIGMAVSEAVSNAMIHGNLEIDSSLRSNDPEMHLKLLQERPSQPPFSERRVKFTIEHSADQVQLTVEDSGKGFDTTNLPDPTDPANLLLVSGRGILLMRTFMDGVDFNSSGNRVQLTKRADNRASGTE